eukprot:2194948-Rhodomonas_salina.3
MARWSWAWYRVSTGSSRKDRALHSTTVGARVVRARVGTWNAESVQGSALRGRRKIAWHCITRASGDSEPHLGQPAEKVGLVLDLVASCPQVSTGAISYARSS